jgi:hypothetical protein
MNDLLSPPPERDLPGAADIRRMLVTTVAIDGRRTPARLAPAVAAGAAVLVAGGGIAAVTLLTGPGAGLSPGTQPDPYAGVCLAGPHPTPSYPDNWLTVSVPPASSPPAGSPPATSPPASSDSAGSSPVVDPSGGPLGPSQVPGRPEPRTVVAFDDQYGTLALVGTRVNFQICAVGPDGTAIPANQGPAITSQIDPAEIARRGLVLGGVDFGSPLAVDGQPAKAAKPFHYLAVGWVGPDVARVTVTWTGQRPVQAAVDHGFFAARLVVSAGVPHPERGFVARAYDANGRRLAVVDNSMVPTAQQGVTTGEPAKTR